MIDVMIQLLENFAMVLVVVYFYSAIKKKLYNYPKHYASIVMGIIFAAISIIAMQRPVEIADGIIMDARVILIALAGFIGGLPAILICTPVIIMYRIYLGGVGTLAGVTNALLACGLGYGFYHLRGGKRNDRKILLYMSGATVVISIVCAVFLPYMPFSEVLFKFIIPTAFIYPVGLYAYGIVLLNEDERISLESELKRVNAELESLVSFRANQIEEINQGLIEEIKVRKETEAALVEAERIAKDANKMKSEFLANMSHEIRTPLNAIIGYHHLLKGTELTEKQKNFVRKMGSSSNNLLSIINDILDFSKIEAGKIDFAKHPFNLYKMIGSLVDTVSYELLRKELEMFIDIDSNVPEWIVGDSNHFRQILLNVLSNAVKFTNKGQIRIHVLIEETDNGPFLGCIIKDTGIGVKKEKLELIFDEFTQANMTINRKFGGTGLGLAITKKLVDAIGGKILFDSEYGKGTTVSITLPMKKSYQKVRRFDEKVNMLIFAKEREDFRFFENQLIKMGAEVHFFSSLDQLDHYEGISYLLITWEEGNNTPIEIIDEVRKRTNTDLLIDFVTNIRAPYIQRFLENQNEYHVYSLPLGTKQVIDRLSNTEYVKSDLTLEEQQHIKAIKGKKILIVEDNPLNQDIQRTIFEQKGGRVIIAENGQEAVDIIDKAHFDIVLMDIHMPVLGGCEATKIIRKQYSQRELPIIAMTADVQPQLKEKIEEVEMNDYIMKPFNISEVYRIVARWL